MSRAEIVLKQVGTDVDGHLWTKESLEEIVKSFKDPMPINVGVHPGSALSAKVVAVRVVGNDLMGVVEFKIQPGKKLKK